VATFKHIKWKRLSGAVLSGRVVKEDKKFLFVKSDKYPSEREFDFTVPKYAIKETPDVFEITEIEDKLP
jgi:hypothetical protein